MSVSRKTFYANRANNKLVYLDQFGVSRVISGMIVSSHSDELLIYLPNEEPVGERIILTPSREDWESLLKTLDNPSYFEMDTDGKTVKAIHRKCQRKVGGDLQWKIWRRDGFKCVYCGAQGGINNITLSIDHFIPVERGGTDTENNLISACRKCNRKKADLMPQQFLTLGEFERIEKLLGRS
jgi:5-methylcytosine-specific restriction endonuclease McrA